MNQVKSPSSMLESLQPAPRGVLKYSGWILLRNAQVQNTLRLYCQHAERLVQVTFSAVQTAQVTAAQAMTRWTEGRRTLCRGTAGRLQPWGCSPRCPAAPLVRWNLSLLLTCYTRYINSFFFLKKQSLSTQGQTATQEFARHVGQTNTTPPDRTRMTLSRQKRRKSPLKVDRKCSATNCSKTFKDW